jgi:molybdopterin converting factor small subunit
MASITVRFHGLWRKYLDVDSVSLQADELKEALAQIEEQFGPRFREQFQARGIQVDRKIQDYSVILLNGVNVRNLEQTKLSNGDILQLFPPALGG